MSDPASAPRIVGTHRGINLIALGGEYCGIPQALGPVDPFAERRRGNPDVIWDETIAALRERIDRLPWRWYDPLYSDTALTELGRPEVIEIEPIHTCNLRCVMCHVSYEEPSKQRLDLRFLDRLRGLEGKWAKLGSLYEPVAHPEFAEIARRLTEQGMVIDLVTNGTLFTPALIESIRACRFGNVTISFDGIRPATYERIRRRASFVAAVDRIRAFKAAVKAHNPHCYFQINYTVLRSNIDEIAEAVDFWEQEDFDHIGFIAMVRRADDPVLDEETVEPALDRLYLSLDQAARRVIDRRYRITLSSPHFRRTTLEGEFPRNVGLHGAGLVVSDNQGSRLPYSASTHFQNGSFPGMPVSCRSPFKFARISYDGQVQLCYMFDLGNIYDSDLLALWQGQRARHVRDLVRRDAQTCHGCEYYGFCIKANEVDYGSPDTLVSNYRPVEVGKSWLYRFWRWRNMYYAIPRGHGFTSGDTADADRCAEMGIIADLRPWRAASPGAGQAPAAADPACRNAARGSEQVEPPRRLLLEPFGARPGHQPRRIDLALSLLALERPILRGAAAPSVRSVGSSPSRSRAGIRILEAADEQELRRRAGRRWPGLRSLVVGALRAAAERVAPRRQTPTDPRAVIAVMPAPLSLRG